MIKKLSLKFLEIVPVVTSSVACKSEREVHNKKKRKSEGVTTKEKDRQKKAYAISVAGCHGYMSSSSS